MKIIVKSRGARMNTALKIPEAARQAYRPALKTKEAVRQADRPGWIPAHIIYDWDTCPYAYQTEEELMPAGGLHGQLLAYIMEILRLHLEDRERMLLMDTFMLYRDRKGVKRRVAPDLLAMPRRFPPPSAYDLDTEPPPLAVAEVTSPKSHLKDLMGNVTFYAGLGVPAYLAIDAISPQGRLRDPFELHLWRKTGGRIRQTQPDTRGRLLMPEMKIRVRAKGQRLVFTDSVTGRLLRDTGQFRVENERLKTVAGKEHRRAEMAEKEAGKEHRRAEMAEKEAGRLAELLKSAGIDPYKTGLPRL